MESGQTELSILWNAYVERFSGRRVAAALSFLLVPVVAAVGWIVKSPAVGVTAAAGVLACFVFLVAFAMAHKEAAPAPAPPRVSAAPRPAGAEDVAVADLHDEPPADGGSVTRLAG
ncbi:MAG: hypothetical protein ACXVK4_10350 [Acidimicrobiia bacterium]